MPPLWSFFRDGEDRDLEPALPEMFENLLIKEDPFFFFAGDTSVFSTMIYFVFFAPKTPDGPGDLFVLPLDLDLDFFPFLAPGFIEFNG